MYTYTLITQVIAQFPLFAPRASSPLTSLFIPLYLLGNPPLAWCNPVHLSPRLLVNWPPLSHSLPIPSPFQIPNTPGQLCASLRRHCDPGFSWSGTVMFQKNCEKIVQNIFSCRYIELQYGFNYLNWNCFYPNPFDLEERALWMNYPKLVMYQYIHLEAVYQEIKFQMFKSFELREAAKDKGT